MLNTNLPFLCLLIVIAIVNASIGSVVPVRGQLASFLVSRLGAILSGSVTGLCLRLTTWLDKAGIYEYDGLLSLVLLLGPMLVVSRAWDERRRLDQRSNPPDHSPD